MSEFDDIYSDRIMALAANIGRIGRLAAPDGTAEKHSKLCGSHIVVDVAVENGVVTDYAHEVRACLLGQATAAVMAEHIVGSTDTELRALRETMLAMLKTNGPVPAGRWADLAYLEPIKDFRLRHTSTMLVFDAVVEALNQIVRERSTAAAAAAE